MDASFVGRPRSNREAVRKFQRRALQRIVRHAATRVPYYRELFRRTGLRPDDIQTPEDLRQIPITTKGELQSRPVQDFVTEGYDTARCVKLTTSGSTGRPTMVIRSQWEQLKLQAYRLRSQALSGLRVSDVRASLNTRSQGARPLDRFGIYRMQTLNETDPADLVRSLRRLRPDVILSRPTILETTAREASRLPGGNPPCRLLFAGAEIVTPAARKLFEEAWKCRVFVEYGTNEFVLVAAECAECGLLHTCDDAVLTEVLRDGGPVAPGETGQVICTGLHSYVMPFIRFDLDDAATRPAAAAECSTAFDAMEVVEGRRMDFLAMPDGRALSPYLIQRAIQDVPGVRKFQVEQRELDALVVRIEQAVETDPAGAVHEALRRIVPAVMAVSVETVDVMPTALGAKHRYIRSLVSR